MKMVEKKNIIVPDCQRPSLEKRVLDINRIAQPLQMVASKAWDI